MKLMTPIPPNIRIYYDLTGEIRFAKDGEFFRGNDDGDHGTVHVGPSKEPVRMLRKRVEKISD
jgi:hypothetical protein